MRICYLNKNTELSKLLKPVIEKYCKIVAVNEIIECDLIIIATYSKILRSEQLNKASIGTINCHQGKVPEYRGSSVINWQIINGEPRIYVSILKTTEGIDDGLILAEEWVDGKSPRTIAGIRKETNQRYIKMMESVLKKITETKSLDFGRKQIGDIKYWKHRKPEDSEIKDDMSKEQKHNLIRACEKDYLPFTKQKIKINIDKRKTLQDYSKTREKIDFPHFYSGNEVMNRNKRFSPHSLFIKIPDKVRRELRLSRYNDYDFRVIIIRKETKTKGGIK